MTAFLKTVGLAVVVLVASTTAVILGNDYAALLRERATTNPPLVDGGSLFVYVDEVTGCQYIRPVAVPGSLIPRVAGDGTRHYGCGGTSGRQSDLATNRR